MTEPTAAPTADHRRISVRLPSELADWLEAEERRRVVGKELLVVKAVELLRSAIDHDGATVTLPGAPAGPRPAQAEHAIGE